MSSLHRDPLPPRGELSGIQGYPHGLEEHISLAGLELVVRPIRPQDAEAYAGFIARTGAEDLRMRFFTLERRLPPKELARGASALIGQMRTDNEAMIALARALGMQVEVAPGMSFAVAHLGLQT